MTPKINHSLLLLLGFFFFVSTSFAAEKIDQVYSYTDLKDGLTVKYSWHFYWRKSFKDIKFDSLTGQKISVPSEWNNLSGERFGYGVIASTILVPYSKGKKLALLVPSICNNYNLYINGKIAAGVGVFDTVPSGAVPNYHPQIVLFESLSDTIHLAFEISNFFYREGGINYPLKID
jgi:hypothetical protein